MNKQVLLIIAAFVIVLILVIAGVRLILLQQSVGKYNMYWQLEASKAPEAGELTYIALGDSTAQSIGASRPKNGYVGLISQELSRQAGKPVHIINLSVSGAKVADGLKDQLPKINNFKKPDLITIELGANDMAQFEEKKFRADFAQLLLGLPDGSYVSNMPSFKGGRASKLNENAVRANAVIDDLAQKYPKLFFVNLYAATAGQSFSDFGADLFHPNNKGYKNWAQAFNSKISQNTLAK